MSLYLILKKKVKRNEIITLIYGFISDIKPVLLKEIIEKHVYNINIYKSWNEWWSKNRLLSTRERVNYNIDKHEKKLTSYILELESSFFIWNAILYKQKVLIK